MHETYNIKLEEGLRKEREAFVKLAISPTCKSLINIYQINEFVKKKNTSDNDAYRK